MDQCIRIYPLISPQDIVIVLTTLSEIKRSEECNELFNKLMVESGKIITKFDVKSLVAIACMVATLKKCGGPTLLKIITKHSISVIRQFTSAVCIPFVYINSNNNGGYRIFRVSFGPSDVPV